MKKDTNSFGEEKNGVFENKPKVYSIKVILAITIFFTTFCGGFFLMRNLNSIGKRKEANIVLLFSLLFTLLSFYFIDHFPSRKSAFYLTLLCNIIGAVLLIEYFCKKYFPDINEYENKRILEPFLISFLFAVSYFILHGIISFVYKFCKF